MSPHDQRWAEREEEIFARGRRLMAPGTDPALGGLAVHAAESESESTGRSSIRQDYEAYIRGERQDFIAVFVDTELPIHAEAHAEFLAYTGLFPADDLNVVSMATPNHVHLTKVSTADRSVALWKKECYDSEGTVNTIVYTSVLCETDVQQHFGGEYLG